jgi:hypothetical protein
VENLHAFRDRPWRCRHCYQLTYATRQAVPRHRHVIKVQKIREHLGGSLSLLDGFLQSRKEFIESATNAFEDCTMRLRNRVWGFAALHGPLMARLTHSKARF